MVNKIRSFSAIVFLFMISINLISENITLEKAIDIALEKNETVLSSKEDLINSKYRYKEAFSGALPRIDADFTTTNLAYSSNKEYDEQEDYGFQGELSVVQPLWVGGKVGTGIKIAKVYQNLTKTAFELEQEKIKVNVKKSFYNVLLAKEALNVIRLVKIDADKNLANIEVMFEQGLVSEFDLIKARVRVKSIEPRIIEYENNFALALDSFKSELGLDLDNEIQVNGKLDYENIVIDSTNYIKRAVNFRKELKILELQSKMYRLNEKIAFGDYLPTISAVGVLSSQSTQKDIPDLFDSENNLRTFNVGINVQIPIFHGGATQAKVNQQKIQTRKSKLQLKQTERLVKLESESYYKKLIEARKEIQLQDETVKESEKSLSIANIRYQNGVGTQIEVIDAQTQLEQSSLERLSAIHKYIDAIIMFNYSTGVY